MTDRWTNGQTDRIAIINITRQHAELTRDKNFFNNNNINIQISIPPYVVISEASKTFIFFFFWGGGGDVRFSTPYSKKAFNLVQRGRLKMRDWKMTD